MIALDTNVLLRFFTRDDPLQAAASRALLQTPGEAFFVSDIVLVEFVWSLRRFYHFSRQETAAVVQSLLDRGNFIVTDRDTAQQATRHLAAGGDFADALVIAAARAQGCSSLASFDEAMAENSRDYVIRPTA